MLCSRAPETVTAGGATPVSLGARELFLRRRYGRLWKHFTPPLAGQAGRGYRSERGDEPT